MIVPALAFMVPPQTTSPLMGTLKAGAKVPPEVVVKVPFIAVMAADVVFVPLEFNNVR